MMHYRRSQDMMPPNLGMFVGGGAGNTFTRTLIAALMKIRRLKFEWRVVGTEQEARALIEKHHQERAIQA